MARNSLKICYGPVFEIHRFGNPSCRLFESASLSAVILLSNYSALTEAKHTFSPSSSQNPTLNSFFVSQLQVTRYVRSKMTTNG